MRIVIGNNLRGMFGFLHLLIYLWVVQLLTYEKMNSKHHYPTGSTASLLFVLYFVPRGLATKQIAIKPSRVPLRVGYSKMELPIISLLCFVLYRLVRREGDHGDLSWWSSVRVWGASVGLSSSPGSIFPSVILEPLQVYTLYQRLTVGVLLYPALLLTELGPRVPPDRRVNRTRDPATHPVLPTCAAIKTEHQGSAFYHSTGWSQVRSIFILISRRRRP